MTRSPGLVLVIVIAWTPLVILAWAIATGTHLLAPLVLSVTALSAFSGLRGGLYTGKRDFTGLKIKDNRLVSLDHRGATLEWLPGHNCRLFSRIVWLDLIRADTSQKRRRLILTDLPGIANLPANDFRRLKVWLRLGASYH